MPVFGLDDQQAERYVDLRAGQQQILRLLEAWREIKKESGPATCAGARNAAPCTPSRACALHYSDAPATFAIPRSPIPC
jgi:hypothetical protein